MEFRTTILQFVFDQIYDALVIVHPTESAGGGRKRPLKPEESDLIRDPKPGYNTPLWQVLMRPITPQDVRQRDLIPSAFLQVLSGERSLSGRGLPDSPFRSVIGDLTESYTIGITAVFSDEQGPESKWPNDSWGGYVFNKRTTPPPESKKNPKTLTEQVNGWIWDLDQILNVKTLRPPTGTGGVTLPPSVMIADVYLRGWETRKGFKGSPTEIVLSELVVTLNYTRV